MQWLEAFRQSVGPIRPGGRPLVVTLATVADDGSPRARSLVLRNVADDRSLWFVADGRSEKATELAHRNDVEVVAWLAEPRVQFRLRGRARIVNDDTARDGARRRLWQSLSDASRALFVWPTPGEARTADDSAFPEGVPASEPVPAHFLLIALMPDHVERLEINVHPHRRTVWREAGGWRSEEINP